MRICLHLPPTSLNHHFHPVADLPCCVPPSLKQSKRWYRNINLFSITYAFRPRLRDRLTLSRLALLRKPWAFGERVFHPLYRYSCQHGLFHTVQPFLRSTFGPNGILSYHPETGYWKPETLLVRIISLSSFCLLVSSL